MRGKPAPETDSRDSVRITPAHAGKTPYITYEVATDRDHPRACGENKLRLLHADVRYGITPAHAGKTYQRTAYRLL